jgi:hypothetical protein
MAQDRSPEAGAFLLRIVGPERAIVQTGTLRAPLWPRAAVPVFPRRSVGVSGLLVPRRVDGHEAARTVQMLDSSRSRMGFMRGFPLTLARRLAVASGYYDDIMRWHWTPFGCYFRRCHSSPKKSKSIFLSS